PLSDAGTLQPNVVDFEPHGALFVPEEDPLLFYRKIAGFATAYLEPGGAIFMEINETLGKEVVELFNGAGFKTELRKDLQQKERMVKAWQPV
ncbi:MAG TPA: peptide chain release factor N(5)-glutamine methyltransferase, partial [Chitinophagaceae bacterium]